MAWILVLIAALLEIVWALALKVSDGFTKPWPSILGVTTAILSFVLLSLALRSLPVGTAYAIWVGLGALGVALAGIVALGESASTVRLACLTLILIGVVGLRATEG
ncbi:DMT family transporter [Actinomadura alba]|uniref:Multidrug efflux SMR transporter n=1 Tax=Actinomadura alba TaxID=406431 RepID=A0ABR7LRG0_9ACTN|nr:multidrug efflux SMR transporter [Actinomadura alba]MBC6467253.1 multidrug efflux SMR transporter [Actinomadura alba]